MCLHVVLRRSGQRFWMELAGANCNSPKTLKINYFIAFVKIDFFFKIFPLHVEVKDREKDEPLPS